MNATTHGGYANAPTIDHGPFTEDPTELDALRASLIDDFQPATPIERAIAQQYAHTVIQAERVTKFEAHELTAKGTFTRPGDRALSVLERTTDIGTRLARRQEHLLKQLNLLKARQDPEADD